jgi:SAM-dependent methyltransferase
VNAAADDEQIEGAAAQLIEIAGHRGDILPAFSGYSLDVATIDDVRAYWNRQVHDLKITRHPVGSRPFFDDLDQYHFEKLHYLLRLVDFDGYRGRMVLEVGCGAGTDLARFAKGGAVVTGVDLTAPAIDLARTNFAQLGLPGRFEVADGERLPFPDNTFDLVYAHGVVQYTASPGQMIGECRRVLKPGGEAIFQVYNRWSWLYLLSKMMKVGLEHEDAPVLMTFSIGEFRRLLAGFIDVRVVPERFPVKSRLHGGWKGALYNGLFVGGFNMLPRRLVRRFGWHLMGFCRK